MKFFQVGFLRKKCKELIQGEIFRLSLKNWENFIGKFKTFFNLRARKFHFTKK